MKYKKIAISLSLLTIFILLVACGTSEKKEQNNNIDVHTSYGMKFALPVFSEAGETQQIVPTGALEAGAVVNYHSSDNSIATVDMDGNVTAVSPGQAIITIVVEANGQSIEHTVEVVCEWE